MLPDFKLHEQRLLNYLLYNIFKDPFLWLFSYLCIHVSRNNCCRKVVAFVGPFYSGNERFSLFYAGSFRSMNNHADKILLTHTGTTTPQHCINTRFQGSIPLKYKMIVPFFKCLHASACISSKSYQHHIDQFADFLTHSRRHKG